MNNFSVAMVMSMLYPSCKGRIGYEKDKRNEREKF